MLSLVEKLLFLFLVVASLLYSLVSWRAVYQVIRRGAGEWPTWAAMSRRGAGGADDLADRAPHLANPAVDERFSRHDRVGLCLLCPGQRGRCDPGLFPVTFLGHNAAWRPVSAVGGPVYRVGAGGDGLFPAAAFCVQGPGVDVPAQCASWWSSVRQGSVRRDSLLVGLFILGHVGFRWLGESFAVAQEGGDWFRPLSMLLAQAWSGWSARCAAGGASSGLVGGAGADPGLYPLFPLYQTLSPDPGGRQFLDQAGADLAGRAGAGRFRGRVHRGVRRRQASSSCRGRIWWTPMRASCATAARMSARPMSRARSFRRRRWR